MQLFYDDDQDYPVEVYDSVAISICDGDARFPATIKKIHAKANAVTVSFEGIDPILDLIILRKSARVPFSSVEFVGRGW